MSLIEQYADKDKLAVSRKSEVKRFQQGGPMGAPAPGPAEVAGPPQGGGGDIMAMVEAYAQQPSPELAVQIADTLVGMMAAEAQQMQNVPAARVGGNIKRVPVFKKEVK